MNLGSGVTAVVMGAQGLVLASQTRMTMGTRINVSGATGGNEGG